VKEGGELSPRGVGGQGEKFFPRGVDA